jgi:hypothetical protein
MFSEKTVYIFAVDDKLPHRSQTLFKTVVIGFKFYFTIRLGCFV